MNALEILSGLVRNNAQCNERVYAVCTRLSPGDYQATRVAFFPSLRLTFEHLYIVDIYSFDALTSGGRGRAVGGEIRIERAPATFDVETIGDMLLHLSEPPIHHRGQVHAMVSGTGVKPPQLDECFLRVDRPTADRELRQAGLLP